MAHAGGAGPNGRHAITTGRQSSCSPRANLATGVPLRVGLADWNSTRVAKFRREAHKPRFNLSAAAARPSARAQRSFFKRRQSDPPKSRKDHDRRAYSCSMNHLYRMETERQYKYLHMTRHIQSQLQRKPERLWTRQASKKI